jgi:hypothetical protein
MSVPHSTSGSCRPHRYFIARGAECKELCGKARLALDWGISRCTSILPGTATNLEWDNIVKAYESDQYVVLSDKNLKRMNMKATQTIDIQRLSISGRCR